MKTKYALAVLTLLALLVSFAPPVSAVAMAPAIVPPVDMFQLPWEQGASWVAYDGFDNGFKRLFSSPHYYINGGAVDFAPHKNMRVGEDTSNAWVTAAASGTVVQTTVCSLQIDHGNGWVTDYQFLAHMQVKLGDAVYRNQRLAVIADGLGEKFCPPALEPDVPHLHFSLRPNMRNATFSGWLISYIPLLNKTTFMRGGQSLGSFQPILNTPEIQIVLRDPITWDTIYTGSVDASRYERWPFVLSDTTNFTVVTTVTTGDLVPLLVLLDANGNEITRAAGTLSSTQPAGHYYIQIQSPGAAGFYTLLLHKNSLPQPSGPNVSVSVIPASVPVGQTAVVTVNLGSVPADGYTSAEFTCTYDGAVVEAANITIASLFGTDPAFAINGPQNAKFIVAIAGSHGSKAAASDTAFTFSLTGLQAGQTPIECKARVSKGDNTLTDVQSGTASLTVGSSGPMPTLTATITPPSQSTATSIAPTTSITAAASETSTGQPSASPTASPTATPTSTPSASAALTGDVRASKPVVVSLYKADASLAASVTADSNGSFSLSASAGSYTAVASASGFLKAQGSVTLLDAQTSTLPTISLLAGDIDGNNVIDQYDAMTIGMNYNGASPAAADLNNDGVINVLDLELLARNYRASGAIAWA